MPFALAGDLICNRVVLPRQPSTAMRRPERLTGGRVLLPVRSLLRSAGVQRDGETDKPI
jgi:hypothetical protein